MWSNLKSSYQIRVVEKGVITYFGSEEKYSLAYRYYHPQQESDRQLQSQVPKYHSTLTREIYVPDSVFGYKPE